MRLTYEQHQELLELANYLAKARRNTMRQGMKLDDLISAGYGQESKHIRVLKDEPNHSSSKQD